MKRKERTVPLNISVPLSLKKKMEKHQEINWSATACRAFQKQLQAQDLLDQFKEASITEEEAIGRALLVQHPQSKRTGGPPQESAKSADEDATVRREREALIELEETAKKLQEQIEMLSSEKQQVLRRARQSG